MSTDKDLQTVKAWFDALADNRLDDMHQYHSDDIVWELMPGVAERTVPWTGTFHGRAGVERCLEGYRAVESLEFRIEEPLTRRDGTIVVPGYSDYRVVGTEHRFQIEFVEYFRFKDGKISFVKVYGDTAGATDALGKARQKGEQ